MIKRPLNARFSDKAKALIKITTIRDERLVKPGQTVTKHLMRFRKIS